MVSKFTDVPDDENYMFKKVRDGLEIGVHPVIFGYRIRAGVIGDYSCYLDYCAGAEQKEVENIYSLVLSIMNKRLDDRPLALDIRDRAHHVFKNFPQQTVKPMFNDFECFMKLSELCGPEIISVKLPNLAARKVKHTISYHASAFDLLVNMGSFNDLTD